jgi:hypothetical protein
MILSRVLLGTARARANAARATRKLEKRLR